MKVIEQDLGHEATLPGAHRNSANVKRILSQCRTANLPKRSTHSPN